MVTKLRVEKTVTLNLPNLVQKDGTQSFRPPPVVTALNQETMTDGHPFFFAMNRKGFTGRDVGGGFSTRRYLWDTDNDAKLYSAMVSVGEGTYRNGNIYAISPTSSHYTSLYNSVAAVADSTMDSWGASAVNQVIPTKAPVELATAAAELIGGGLPKLIGGGLLKSVLKDYRKVGRHAKAGADEFLNLEFGIKPLIGDLVGTAKSIVSAAERIQQLERDSGKLVRRHFNFPDRSETFYTTSANQYPTGWSYAYLWKDSSPKGRLEQWTTYETRRWFSGAFTYHLDLGLRHRSALFAAADNARLLLGVKLDAEVLWNLTPWSWLADWYGNMGDVISNMSNFSRDGLVMPYGYIMAESSAKVHSRLSGLNWFDAGLPTVVNSHSGFVRKQRRPANPFGFGLSDMVLDTRQLSILNALGISKMPRK